MDDELEPSQAAPSRSQMSTTSASQIEDVEPDDCIKILLATDNHIGYNEKDPVRGQDSINTFKEILELAVNNDVDMLLLAGDLFHENKPSRASLYQVISLLRDHTMGPRPINLQIVSDAGIGLGHEFNFPQINYEDENLNIGLPVFSIHGNHDDPQGAGPEGALCALDILSASGLVNYFGRQELPGSAQNDQEAQDQGLQIKPILISKGRTKLALYGIGNIRDERFNAEMRKNRISLFQPDDDGEAWFNLLLIHQNRAARGIKNSVPENGFGDDVNLVVWGHEHDCRITPEPVAGCNYMITQPGSSVATSLAAGEAIPKHVAILKIQDTKYQLDPIPLRTVRPFVFDDVFLAEEREINNVKLDTKQQITKFLKAKVEELIEKANTQWDEIPGRAEDETPMFPLIRLRVDFSNPGGEPFEVGNPQRFGQEFTGRVANPRDIVQFYRKKTIERKTKVTIDRPTEMDIDAEDPTLARVQKVKVETLVHQYLEAQQLQVIPENAIATAVNQFIEKDERDAIKSFIKESLEERRQKVMQTEISETLASDEDIDDQITKAKERASELHREDGGSSRKSKPKGKKAAKARSGDESDFGEESEHSNASSAQKSGPAKKAPAKKAAPKKGKEKLFNSDSEEASDSDAKPKKKAPAKKAAAPKASSKKQPALSFAPSRASGSRAAKAKAPVVDIPDSDSD